MRIAIDISQIAHQGTGVANYTQNLVKNLLKIDKKNKYVLFFASLRKKVQSSKFKVQSDNAKLKTFKIPPTLLEFLWNRLHIFPIEWLVGRVDVYFSSDWLQAPSKAKKVTTIHDLTPLKFPKTFPPQVVSVHKRRLKWVKKECDFIICDSESTKKDAIAILGIEEKRLKVIYPGIVTPRCQ